MNNSLDRQYMKNALTLAELAAARGEVPVGAVITINARQIGEGFNQPIENNDPSSHAELNAIRQACQAMENYRLPGATLYTTLEPCPMCAGAIIHARIKRLVIATADPRTGCCGSVFNLTNSAPPFNHKVSVEFGLLAEESASLLKQFFKARR
jgi:tRNA(adenine34) deaminase